MGDNSGLRHYATSWENTGSSPVDNIGIVIRSNPSNFIMAVRLVQPLTERGTTNLHGGKGPVDGK
jgi:hypothetical protein